jgi:uncharacterized protein (TIGR00369 family)
METMPNLLKGWLDGSISPPPIVRLLHIELISCEEGISRAEMRVGKDHHNPMDIVHGGIFCDLADVAMGTALASILAENETFTTTDIGAHYFVPIQEGLLVAEARVIRRGKATAYVECDLMDGEKRLVARLNSTCLIRIRS